MNAVRHSIYYYYYVVTSNLPFIYDSFGSIYGRQGQYHHPLWRPVIN